MQRRWWMWSSFWRICACELYSLSYSLDGTLPDKWPAEWTKMEGKGKADDDDEHEDVDVVLACTAASSVWHCHWFMAIGCYLSFVAQTFLLSIWLFVDRVGHLDGYFLLSIGCCCSSWLLCIELGIYLLCASSSRHSVVESVLCLLCACLLFSLSYWKVSI